MQTTAQCCTQEARRGGCDAAATLLVGERAAPAREPQAQSIQAVLLDGREPAGAELLFCARRLQGTAEFAFDDALHEARNAPSRMQPAWPRPACSAHTQASPSRAAARQAATRLADALSDGRPGGWCVEYLATGALAEARRVCALVRELGALPAAERTSVLSACEGRWNELAQRLQVCRSRRAPSRRPLDVPARGALALRARRTLLAWVSPRRSPRSSRLRRRSRRRRSRRLGRCWRPRRGGWRGASRRCRSCRRRSTRWSSGRSTTASAGPRRHKPAGGCLRCFPALQPARQRSLPSAPASHGATTRTSMAPRLHTRCPALAGCPLKVRLAGSARARVATLRARRNLLRRPFGGTQRRLPLPRRSGAAWHSGSPSRGRRSPRARG